jgi:CO/xanthine dehydrogenase FAD-binding subunit
MELTWYFPTRLEEVPALLARPGVLVHAGGTALLARNLTSVRGLLDTGHLPLRFFRHRQDIFLGGSLAAAPLWSDLIGPLLALEAELVLIGGSEGAFPLERYLGDKELGKNSLITTIRFQDPGWAGCYHRETLTAFDYPAFTLTCLLRREGERVRDLRLALTGTTARAQRLRGLEETLAGTTAAKLASQRPRLPQELRFAARKLGAPDYLRALAELALARALARLLES